MISISKGGCNILLNRWRVRRCSWWRPLHVRVSSRGCLRCGSSLLCQHEVGPPLGFNRVLTNNLGKNLHPSIFLRCTIRVEINRLTVAKPNAKAFLDKHVTLLFLRESRLPPTSTFARRLLPHKSRLIVDQLASSCQMNGCSWLAGSLMVSCEFRAF